MSALDEPSSSASEIWNDPGLFLRLNFSTGSWGGCMQGCHMKSSPVIIRRVRRFVDEELPERCQIEIHGNLSSAVLVLILLVLHLSVLHT